MTKKNIITNLNVKITVFFNEIDSYLLTLNKLRTKIKDGDPKSLVTQADVKIQTIFTNWVVANFKGHSVIGEEKDSKLFQTDYIWYIDPIDGTNLFSRNIEEWGIIISLTYKQEPINAWIYFPYQKIVYSAIKGGGAYKNKGKISSSKVVDLGKTIISGVYLNTLDREKIMIGELWKKSMWGMVGRSLAKDFCELAEGKIDIAICYDCYVWEYKALYLLVVEAGGICSGFDQSKFNIKSDTAQSFIAYGNKKLMKSASTLIKVPPSLKQNI